MKSEQALLIFTVYLVLFANIYIHLSEIHPTMHGAGFFSPLDSKPLSFDIIVFVRRITASNFFDKASSTCHKAPKAVSSASAECH